MKKVLLITILALFAVHAHAQSSLPLVGVTREEFGDDTLRTFSLLNTDHDQSILKLIRLWGEPLKNTPGNVSWQKVSIPMVGNDLTVELYDGIVMVVPNKGQMFKTFRDEADKAERLKNISSNDHRVTDIIIFNSARKKIITTQALENAVLQYLTDKLK